MSNAPQNFIFCGADFSSTIDLDFQQILKPFLHFSQQHMQCDFFLKFIAFSYR